MQRHRTSRLSRIVAVIAFLLGGTLTTGWASAQGKAPSGPIEITVGSSPGGTPDVIMRNVVKIMAEEKIVPNPVVVQNRTGGSWANAYNYVLGKKGDENTLLCIAQPVYTTPIMQGTPSVIDQLVPIAGFIQSELVLLVAPGSPVQDSQGLRRGGEEGAAPAAHRRRSDGRHRHPGDGPPGEGGRHEGHLRALRRRRRGIRGVPRR